MPDPLDEITLSPGENGRLDIGHLPDDRPLASMLHVLLTATGAEGDLLAQNLQRQAGMSLDLAGVRFDGDRVVLWDVAGSTREVNREAFGRLMARWIEARGVS